MNVAVIRPATDVDLSRLVRVEIEAGRLFHTVGMAEVAHDMPNQSDLLEAVTEGRVWVAQLGVEPPAGYVVAEVLDGNAHVAQVSVAPEYAGRRIGQALIEWVETWGRAARCPATTLTTFANVPWNAPYYYRLGYRVLAHNGIGPDLARTMAREAAMPGIDGSLRCAMWKSNDRAPTVSAVVR